MNITNVTDYDNMKDVDYNDTSSLNFNCAINENYIEMFIPAILFTIPCGLSFSCIMSLMVYTLKKPLINNKWWRNFYTQILQLDVS